MLGLVNLKGRTLLSSPLKLKAVFVAKMCRDLSPSILRSQVIVLGCFSIGKTMTCDLCFVLAVLSRRLESFKPSHILNGNLP